MRIEPAYALIAHQHAIEGASTSTWTINDAPIMIGEVGAMLPSMWRKPTLEIDKNKTERFTV